MENNESEAYNGSGDYAVPYVDGATEKFNTTQEV
jgi:hypothetical protein